MKLSIRIQGSAATADHWPRSVLLAAVFLWLALASAIRPAAAVEAGEPAPDFTMPSTMGGNVSLSDYRGKKWVLLEFYGADFAPT